ncbi:ANM_HP_G0244320.mRNA.1.CDS.1 [Saccharomyces cerevisiae]|nr:ANM_HP_G0244320.mRNA.1.CDS.1 [Saccharomyces cerevisiae]CAI7003359.1 ANM_HP_G0244320.mRNA.1.CDS.1 [Saccharomyces cerevisiae]
MSNATDLMVLISRKTQNEDPNLNQWSICDDFSEGRQVNDAFVGGSNIPHTLKDYKSSNEILPTINTAIPTAAVPQQNIAPPFLNTNSSATDSNPNTNLEDSLFFDHDLLSSSITNTNNGQGSNNGRQASKDDTLNLLDTTVNSNNNHNANNEENHLAQEHLSNDADIVANPNDHLLSLPTDSELQILRFLKNTNELTDEHRWI